MYLNIFVIQINFSLAFLINMKIFFTKNKFSLQWKITKQRLYNCRQVFLRRNFIYFSKHWKNCKINSFANKNKQNWNDTIEFLFNWLDNWIVHCNKCTTKTNWAVRCINPPLWSINLTCTISWLKKLAFYYYMPSRDVLKMVWPKEVKK
jgi:hypothetical protein